MILGDIKAGSSGEMHLELPSGGLVIRTPKTMFIGQVCDLRDVESNGLYDFKFIPVNNSSLVTITWRKTAETL